MKTLPHATEHEEQVALVEWCRLSVRKYPELAWLHAIPNAGRRSPRFGMEIKREGLLPGTPDLFIPAARHGKHGLYLELKVGRNKPSPEQLAFIEYVRSVGYEAHVCWGWLAAREKIEEYLG